MLRTISASEKAFITTGCSLGIRCDGRAPEDYRSISIENKVFPQSNGSSRVRLGDVVDVMCSVKADITEPSKDKPKEGKLEVNVDISPSCRSNLDDRSLAALGSRIADQIQDSLIGSDAIGWEELCIIEGKYCWQISIDLLIIQLDGDPTDACGLAVFAALHCTQLPQLQLKVGKAGTFDDFEVTPDMADNIFLPLRAVPVLVTLHKVGTALLVDGTHDEQTCSDSAICFSINEFNHICCTSFAKTGSISTSDLTAALQRAGSTAGGIFMQLQAFLAAAKAGMQDESRFPDLSALRMGLLV